MTPYDKAYYQGVDGTRQRPGCDAVRRFDAHWWSNRFYAALCRRCLRHCGGRDVLELGCAHGYILARLERRFRTRGMDASAYAVAQCRERAPRSEAREGDLERDLRRVYADASCDLILAKYVLEHLERPGAVLLDAAALLRPGGFLVLSVPNTASPLRRLKGADWIGARDPTHVSVLPPGTWRGLVAAAGLRVVRTFSDGFWDVPYLRGVPPWLQFPFFAWPAALQLLTTVPFIPARLGENLLLVARKPGGRGTGERGSDGLSRGISGAFAAVRPVARTGFSALLFHRTRHSNVRCASILPVFLAPMSPVPAATAAPTSVRGGRQVHAVAR